MELRQCADKIIAASIGAVLPDAAVEKALRGKVFPGRVFLVAAGKAAWQMAKSAYGCLGSGIYDGMVITKYDHVMGSIGNLRCFEAGHPVPDENSFAATREALKLVGNLQPEDTVLFLLSGGGSALFEVPLVSGEELQSVTGQLLACGADIVEINTIRKRLSAVKGGRFAEVCAPAQVFAVVLSDVLGDRLDSIASGPACPDSSTAGEAVAIAKKYGLQLSEQAWQLLEQETPKELHNVTTLVTGSVKALCAAAAKACRDFGYEPVILTDDLSCEAKEAGALLAAHVKQHQGKGRKLAFIAGDETVVQLTGTGKGGRNQELALSAAMGIEGLAGTCVFSVGSDGTDGPTDAAGGYVDATTAARLRNQGVFIPEVLQNNDAYHALQKVDGLIFTGPTGTNVIDVAVALIDG